MARDVCDGYILVNERTFVRMSSPDLDKLGFEMQRRLRDVRGVQPELNDTQALQLRNRKLQRLSQASMVLESLRRKRKK